MAENKTRPTNASVKAYLTAIEDDARRKDCETIAALMSRITKARPRMWGPGIVGFDTYHYKYASGREGDSAMTGFASRKGDISVYLVASGLDQEPGESDIELRQIFEAEDFGEALTPELRAQEERLRKAAEGKK